MWDVFDYLILPADTVVSVISNLS
uniref:Uncharacterized protein n=1 Tax=Rhizophora mucronata TaxID=61149 RepID=A0A2P2NQV4_RHIMU